MDHPKSPQSPFPASTMAATTSYIQCLFPFLALLGSGTVERKLVDPHSTYVGRISTTWSSFGALGVLRAYLKLGFGLANVERAGAQLYSGGAYTAKQTKHALAACTVGASDSKHWWQDDRSLLLGRINLQKTPWTRPHAVVIGYAQCPQEGRRGTYEQMKNLYWAIATFFVAPASLYALYPGYDQPTLLWSTAVILSGLVSMVVDCALPLAIRSDSSGVSPLGSVPPFSLYHKGSSVARDPFAVINSAERSSCIVVYRDGRSSNSPWSRAGDRGSIRLLSIAASFGIVTLCTITFVLLGRATQQQTIRWLSIELVIFASRYILWSDKSQWVAGRGRSLIYITTGSLCTPIQPDETADGFPASRTISAAVMRVVIASTHSRLLNEGGHSAELPHMYSGLTRLATCTPADILLAPFCEVASHVWKNHELSFHIICLPWPFIEELYAAQGIILADLSKCYGLYLAAVVQDGRFIGLTSVHPFDTSTNFSFKNADSEAADYSTPASGCTVEGIVIHSLADGKVLASQSHPLSSEDAERHARLRANVAECRKAAVANGPTFSQVHLHYADGGSAGNWESVRTEPTLTHALRCVDAIACAEKGKDHARCGQYCKVTL